MQTHTKLSSNRVSVNSSATGVVPSVDPQKVQILALTPELPTAALIVSTTRRSQKIAAGCISENVLDIIVSVNVGPNTIIGFPVL